MATTTTAPRRPTGDAARPRSRPSRRRAQQPRDRPGLHLLRDRAHPAGLDPLDRDQQGRRPARRPDLVDQLAARHHRPPDRRRRLPRDHRHPAAWRSSPRSSASRSRSAPRSTWWSTAAGKFAKAVSFMVDVLTGVPSIVAALFIYAAVGHDVRLPAGRVRRVARAGAADDPGRRALDRGDAAAGAARPARGVVRPRACRGGRR